MVISLVVSLLVNMAGLTGFANDVAKAAPAQDRPIAMQQLEADDMGDTPTKTLQGSINSLKVTSGRSQIVKFAQPVVRLSIADPSKADVIPLAPDQIMINGKDRGVTSLIVWDADGQEGIFDLYVENDTTEVLRAIETIAPNEKIHAAVTNDSFIVSGQVSNSVILDEIRKTAGAYGYRDDKFVDLTESPVPQVVLEVKIAEASRSVARDLKSGFSIDTNGLTLTRFPNAPRPTLVGTQLVTTPSGLIPAQGLGRPVVDTIGGNNVGGIIGSLFPRTDTFQVFYDALETQGKITTLAEPTLVCTHGRTADFLAGGEYPYVSGTDQNGSPIINFKEFGVKLNFTPWIAIRSGRIELKVQPEVSNIDRSNCQPGAAGVLICGLSKRSTSTTVELQDGESLMVSGILTQDDQNNWTKVPFIGDIPVIGEMFKNSSKTQSRRELIVVVTPRIVKKGDYGSLLSKSD